MSQNIGIWIRVSTEDQAKGESPENHRRRAEAFCELKGWKISTVYDLSGVSGKSVMDHPECQRMMRDIKSGAIKALVFSKLARLARNTRELLEFSDYFEKHDAAMVSLSEQIDTSTPAGRLFFTIVAAMAQWEREEIAERVKASVPIRAKQGKHLSGVAPFGYQWKGHDFLLDPKEAPVRKLMFELFAKEKRLKAVARLLNERGHRTRTGAKFSDSTVRRLLSDPTAKGRRRSNYTTTGPDGKSAILKDESEWEWHDCPAIVSAELFDEVAALLSKNSPRKAARPAVQLFGGLLWCHCGSKMYKRAKSDKYVCQGCKNKMQKDDLESIFSEQLKAFFFDPAEIAAVLQDENDKLKAQEDELRVLEQELKTLESDIQQLFALNKRGEIPTEGFGRHYVPLDERRAEVEEAIPRLQAEIDVGKIASLSRSEVTEGAQNLYSRWDELSEDEKRDIIHTIVEKIMVGEEEIEIFLFMDPSSELQSPPSQDPFIPPPSDNHKATPSHGFIAAIS